jgi:hypothetical protein
MLFALLVGWIDELKSWGMLSRVAAGQEKTGVLRWRPRLPSYPCDGEPYPTEHSEAEETLKAISQIEEKTRLMENISLK